MHQPSELMKMSQDAPPEVLIEGVPFAALKMKEVLNWIIRRHTQGYGGWVVTPNIDILRLFENDPSYRAVVASETTIYTADGAPIIWLSKMLGRPLPERVSGSDLFVELTSEAAKNDKSIYLLGGTPGVADEAAKILQEKHPMLRIAGLYAPPYGFERNNDEMGKIRSFLKTAQPDIIFVGLGSPKTEYLIATIRETLPNSWWLGVGVSFSFFTGDVKRAPLWMRKVGLEWFYRVIQEPKRLFKRYFLVGIPFVLRLFIRNLIKRIKFSFKRRI